VLQQVALQPDVVDRLTACYALYQQQLQCVRDERSALLAELTGLQARLDNVQGRPLQQQQQPGGQDSTALQQTASLMPPHSLQFRQDGFEEYTNLADRLSSSLQQEHMVSHLLMYACAQASSHAHMARAMLASYPFWPDGCAMLALLHAETDSMAGTVRTVAPGADELGTVTEPVRMRSPQLLGKHDVS
jgi:hypothetical protein